MAPHLHIALHVPKCAGTTVEEHLARHLGPQGFWSPPKRTRAVPLELLGRKYDARLPGPAGDVRAVSGHFVGRSIERLFGGRMIRRSILMRDPAALMLSWYNYRMMRYAGQGRRPYPFALHLRSMPPDPVAHFLLERWFELPWIRMAALALTKKRAMLEAFLGSLDFVGDVADCDRLIGWISGDLGIPGEAGAANTAEEWQAATGWSRLAMEDLSAEDRAALADRTGLDRYLWLRWAKGEDADPEAIRTAPYLRNELRRPLAEIRRRRIRG